jgi:hypothetical protein
MILYNLPTSKLAGKHDYISSTQEQASGVSLFYRDEPCGVLQIAASV